MSLRAGRCPLPFKGPGRADSSNEDGSAGPYFGSLTASRLHHDGTIHLGKDGKFQAKLKAKCEPLRSMTFSTPQKAKIAMVTI